MSVKIKNENLKQTLWYSYWTHGTGFPPIIIHVSNRYF